MRLRTIVLTSGFAALLGATREADAQCGGVPPPPPPPPPSGEIQPGSRDPADSPPPSPGGGPTTGGPTTGGGDIGGPTTGGGDLGGPTTGGGGSGGPTTGGGSPGGTPPGGGGGGGPVTGGGGAFDRNTAAIVRDRDDWKYWWFTNRTELLDLHARVTAKAARTADGEGGAPRPESEMWRAEAQRALASVLAESDPDLVGAAAVALGRSGDLGEVRALTGLMVDVHRPLIVRKSAALALGYLPHTSDDESADAEEALGAIARSKTERDGLRASATYALGQRGGDSSVPALFELARSGGGTWDVPAAGLSALGISRGAETRPALEWLLTPPKKGRDREWMRRVYAAHGLARLGSRESLPLLLEAADDEQPDVRRAAVLALGALGRSDEEGVDADVRAKLLRVLDKDKDGPCRNMALISLGRMGGKGVGAAIRRAYESGEPIQRTYAAIALGFRAKREDDASLRKLLAHELATRSMVELRGALAVACGIAGATEAVPELRKIASGDGDPALRAHAAVALGLVGDQASAPFLADLLTRTADGDVQGEGALALGLLGDPTALAVLADQVEHGKSHRAQAAAAVALGRIGGPRAAGVFMRILADKKIDPEVREAGAIGLGLLLDPREGRTYTAVGADLNWYATTDTVREILDIH